jgi:hypothetical protein
MSIYPQTQDIDPTEQLLTVYQVRSELGGISGELVRKLLRLGYFPRAFKAGADWVIPSGDVTPELRYRYGPGGPNRHRGRPGPYQPPQGVR